jgi:hypothetical protein
VAIKPSRYLWSRFRRSWSPQPFKDVAVAVVTAALSFLFLSEATPRGLLESGATGVVAALLVEFVALSWRFVWTTPYRDFRDQLGVIDDLHTKLRATVATPKVASTFRFDGECVWLDVTNSGLSARFRAVIGTIGFGHDLDQLTGAWYFNEPECTIVKGDSHRLLLTRRQTTGSGTFVWTAVGVGPDGTDEWPAIAMRSDTPHPLHVHVNIYTDPETETGVLHRTLVLRGGQAVDGETGAKIIAL